MHKPLLLGVSAGLGGFLMAVLAEVLLRWLVPAPRDTTLPPPRLDVLFVLLRGNEGDRTHFASRLPSFGQTIAERTAKALAPPAEAGVSRPPWAPFLVASWMGLVAAGLGLGLRAGQNVYLRRRLAEPTLPSGAGAGLLAGLFAGLAGQLLSRHLNGDPDADVLAQLISWSLLGALVGLGASFAVPNLTRLRGGLGGLLGGLLGGAGFVLLPSLFGQTPGTQVAATWLGVCVGCLVGLAEGTFRRCWLEVWFGSNDYRIVSLGAEPISVGSDPECTVLAAGAAGVALRYRLLRGQVFCAEAALGQEVPVQAGDRRTAGDVAVVVGGRIALPLPALVSPG